MSNLKVSGCRPDNTRNRKSRYDFVVDRLKDLEEDLKTAGSISYVTDNDESPTHVRIACKQVIRSRYNCPEGYKVRTKIDGRDVIIWLEEIET